MTDKITEFPKNKKEVVEGSIVRLKSGSFPMVVSGIEKRFYCSYFDLATGEFKTDEFNEADLIVDTKAVDQGKFS